MASFQKLTRRPALRPARLIHASSGHQTRRVQIPIDPLALRSLLPTNLTAVVGPNGCGKSNIIDAGTLGAGRNQHEEPARRRLRGRDLHRLQVAQASWAARMVELVFDNSDGTIAGPTPPRPKSRCAAS